MSKNTAFPVLPISNPEQTLVLFDFDGTLTKGDSWPRFMWFSVGLGGMTLALPGVLLRLIKRLLNGSLSGGKAKEDIMAVCFKNYPEAAFRQLGADFCRRRLPDLLRPEALEILRAWRDAGCAVALVSASLDVWLRPFCAEENITMICTELAFENGKFSGRFATPNCKYEEKAARIRTAFSLENFTEIVAYGNSSGDRAMFALANRAWKADRFGVFSAL